MYYSAYTNFYPNKQHVIIQRAQLEHRENILKVLIVALRVEQMRSSFIMFSFLYSFYTLISNELFSRHLVNQQH